MEARLLYRGRVWDIYLLAEGEREFARDFVDGELTTVQQAHIRALVRRAADHGLPRNETQFRRLHGYPNLAEFKQLGVRLVCFFDDGRIILTHGFKKKSDRTPRQEIERALRLRDAYFEEKEA